MAKEYLEKEKRNWLVDCTANMKKTIIKIGSLKRKSHQGKKKGHRHRADFGKRGMYTTLP